MNRRDAPETNDRMVADDDVPEHRPRSVMDFDTDRSLRAALEGLAAPSSCVTSYIGRDENRTEKSSTKEKQVREWEMDNLDMETSCAQNLEEEMARLQVLKSYLILDSEREQSFERITALASRIFEVPIALVSLVDLGRQWFMSNRGLGDVRETGRDVAFCAHAILSTHDVFVVNDTLDDPRFANNSLVTGDPFIRFYAGAPLICEEGYKLGTFCIIDTKPHPNGLDLSEKQNLRELSALVMDNMVNRRNERERASVDKSRIIACTAHDMLTPLSGIQLNLSLLTDDDRFNAVMDEQQRELLHAAVSCSDVMGRICHEAIETFRNDVVTTRKRRRASSSPRRPSIKRAFESNGQLIPDAEREWEKTDSNDCESEHEEGTVDISRLVDNLRLVMEPFPKQVPLAIEVDEAVPPVIVGDDLKIFRSAVNYLTNACKKTETGSISLHIYVTQRSGFRQKNNNVGGDVVVFECEDTGPGIDVEKYPNLFVPFAKISVGSNGFGNDSGVGADHSKMTNSGLGLFSVANNISSLGGEYGFRPRSENKTANTCASRSSLVSFGSNENLSKQLGFRDSMTLCTEEEAVTGSVFWFSVPLVLPTLAKSRVEEVKMSPHKCDEEPHIIRRESSADLVPPPSSLSNGGGAHAQGLLDGNHVKNSASITVENNLNGCDDKITHTADEKSERRKINPHESSTVSTTAASSTSTLYNEQKAGPKIAEIKDKKRELPSVQLPVETVEASDQGAGAGLSLLAESVPPDSENATGKKRNKRALVIDDSVTIRKGIDRALTKVGFEVTQACNGMEGLTKLRSTLFDLVLCDFLMPVMDGLDCVKQYRAWEAKHRSWFRQYIVGISAHATKNDAERGLDVGMDNFFAKPVRLQTLKDISASPAVATVSRILDEKFAEGLAAQEEDLKVMLQKQESNQKPDIDETSISSMSHAQLSSGPVCLIAEDSISFAKYLVRAVESLGWRTSHVDNGEDALRLLKMRNWDAVFLDDLMPKLTGQSCVLRFREWEAQNRVARQRNIYLLSGNYTPKRQQQSIYPPGFDGAAGKPVKLRELSHILETATERNMTQSGHLLVR